MIRSSKISSRLSQQLVKHRWWVIISLSILFILFEKSELLFTMIGHNSYVITEVIFFPGFLVASGLLFDSLLHALAQERHAIQLLDSKHELIRELQKAQSWESLTQTIFEFFSRLLPLTSTQLLVYNQAPGIDRSVWTWPAVGLAEDGNLIYQPSESCAVCQTNFQASLHSLIAYPTISSEDQYAGHHGYCLPLVIGDSPIGRIQLYLQKSKSISAEAEELLISTAPEIADAIVSNQQRHAKNMQTLKQATDTQRQLLSRDLHDTLAQHLSYLRFKLEQYSQGESQNNPERMQSDFMRMHDIANESYELVRGTLEIMLSKEPLPLLKVLMDHSVPVSTRANLKIAFSQSGAPRTLQASELRQLFYIYREAVNNIERHASAAKVSVEIVWSDDQLTLWIVDDGRGFNPALPRQDHHYGLEIIKERASILHGQVHIDASPGAGTRMEIVIPLPLSPLSIQVIQPVEEYHLAAH